MLCVHMAFGHLDTNSSGHSVDVKGLTKMDSQQHSLNLTAYAVLRTI